MVSQLVTENCHNRIKCMEKLAEIDEVYAKTAQTFPSQSIRYNKPPTPPRRSKNLHARQVIQQQQLPSRTKPLKADTSDCLSPEPSQLQQAEQRIPRPNFLALRNDPPANRPVRVAPRPPPPISATAAITTDPASPIQEPLNVSLNVTVSPVPQRRARHTSTLDVHPKMPYGLSSSPNALPRSFTSVNFTLRPPSEENVQSPIEICAGPSLTYSSSSYDARQGYQSSLKITVGSSLGQPTAFSAIRTRAQSCQDMQAKNEVQQHKQSRQSPAMITSNAMKTGISLPNIHTDPKRSIVSPLREGKNLTLIHCLHI